MEVVIQKPRYDGNTLPLTFTLFWGFLIFAITKILEEERDLLLGLTGIGLLYVLYLLGSLDHLLEIPRVFRKTDVNTWERLLARAAAQQPMEFRNESDGKLIVAMWDGELHEFYLQPLITLDDLRTLDKLPARLEISVTYKWGWGDNEQLLNQFGDSLLHEARKREWDAGVILHNPADRKRTIYMNRQPGRGTTLPKYWWLYLLLGFSPLIKEESKFARIDLQIQCELRYNKK